MKSRRLRAFWLILPVISGLLATGCDSAPKTSDKNLEHISYEALREMRDKATEKRPVVLVDIRTPGEFDAGHIPGAVNIPDAQVRTVRDPRLNDAQAIVVYAQTYSLYADAAAKALIHRGFKNVYSYPGGLKEWSERAGASP